MNPDTFRHRGPYDVKRSPRGAVVVCGSKLVTDEMPEEMAAQWARELNVLYRMELPL